MELNDQVFRTMIEQASDTILLLDEEGMVVYANPAASMLFGRSPAHVMGEFFGHVITGKQPTEIQIPLREGKLVTADIRFTDAQLQGNSYHIVYLRDVSERKQYEERLGYLSLHDALTGLYNRAYFDNELKRLNKSREYPIALIVMDVDGLKPINDMFGHDEGDNLLRRTAAILLELFRSSDCLVRTGGDEFVALLPRTGPEAMQRVVERIRDKIEEYNDQPGVQIPLSLSIGMAGTEDRQTELAELYKKADELMYRNKRARGMESRSRIMKALLMTLEERGILTSEQAQRLEELCLKLGQKAGLSQRQMADLALLVQVHNLGKVGIPDQILFKPGPLTEEERRIVHQHPEQGQRIAMATADLAGIADLILKHHERWDGQGYPLDLGGEDIPIECRILAIVDTYEAMTHDRPYRRALSHREAIKEIEGCAGSQFDPRLVAKFLEIIQDIPGP